MKTKRFIFIQLLAVFIDMKIFPLSNYASINVKPEGGVGGGPQAYVGHLTSIAFPTLGNLT